MSGASLSRLSIVWKMLAPTPLVVLASLGIVLLIVPPMVRTNVEAAARDAALETIHQYKTVRGIYSRNVVKKVLAHPEFSATVKHSDNINEIPPPATFILDISEALSKEGISLKFYSPFPFANRADRELDAFGAKAWELLKANPEAVISEEVSIGGHRAYRVAVGDVFREQTCVDCHNYHPLSIKKGWKLGDLRGIFEVVVDVERLLDTGDRVSRFVVLSFVASGLLIVLVGIMIGRPIAQRLSEMRGAVQAVADGRLDVDIPVSGSNDEIGALGRALGVFRENAKRRVELEEEQLDLYNQIKSQIVLLTDTNKSIERFVPSTFLKLLKKENIINVELGDYALRDMSVLFTDIRDFTTLSETMTPSDNFRFINNYLGRMGPIIRDHKGFIDKYIGDAIMALFDDPDNAVAAAVDMLQRLERYNQEERIRYGRDAIRIGIGVNTGSLMLGTIGEKDRMDGTVISDAVNLAARVEGLTKAYGVPLMITDNTLNALPDPGKYSIRPLDSVTVKGKTKQVAVFEVLDGLSDHERAAKEASLETYLAAVAAQKSGDLVRARKLFEECLAANPEDVPVRLHLSRLAVDA
ncbi:MAG: adenylate/guanylate cyclase domain-containing protein [Rhodospirillales bacterium]